MARIGNVTSTLADGPKIRGHGLPVPASRVAIVARDARKGILSGLALRGPVDGYDPRLDGSFKASLPTFYGWAEVLRSASS